MAEEYYTTKKLLALRKLTRAIADFLRSQLKDYLTALGPLLHPRMVLGKHVDSSIKETVPSAERAFKELQALYEGIAGARPFNLPKELTTPIDITSSVIEMTPVEYPHLAKTDRESKTVTITSPFKWVLTYSGFSPRRLRELLTERTLTGGELRECVLHYLVMHVVMAKQQGVAKILETLHFPVGSGRQLEFGDLPLTYIAASIATILPPDEVMIESTEVSGMDAFEEIVDLDDVANMHDRLQERLLELVKSHGDELPPKAVDG